MHVVGVPVGLELGRAHADDSFEAAEHVSPLLLACLPVRRAGIRLGGFHEIMALFGSPC